MEHCLRELEGTEFCGPIAKVAVDQDGLYCCGRCTGPFQRIRSPLALPCFANRPGVVCVPLDLLFHSHSPPWRPIRRPDVDAQVPCCVPALRGDPGQSNGAPGGCGGCGEVVMSVPTRVCVATYLPTTASLGMHARI